MPPRIGVHSARALARVALARMAVVASAAPWANLPAGVGMITSSANIALMALAASVLAAAAGKARSPASKSSTTLLGECERGVATVARAHATTRYSEASLTAARMLRAITRPSDVAWDWKEGELQSRIAREQKSAA